MTGNQLRFVVLTLFASASFASAVAFVPNLPGRLNVVLALAVMSPSIVLGWWWSERLSRPHGELRTLGDFFAMPKVQHWSTLGLLVVVGFAAWQLWMRPEAPRDLLLVTVPLPFLPPLLTWWLDHWRAIGRRDAAARAEALRIAGERAAMRNRQLRAPREDA